MFRKMRGASCVNIKLNVVTGYVKIRDKNGFFYAMHNFSGKIFALRQILVGVIRNQRKKDTSLIADCFNPSPVALPVRLRDWALAIARSKQ